MNELRKVEELIFGQWSETSIRNLRPGCVFRMFEDTGEEVIDKDGNKIWVALGDPYLWMGYWTIYSEPKK